MSELSREARDLIAEAKRTERSDARAKARVRAALAIQFAAPLPPAPAAAASTMAAAGTASKLVLICSLTVAGVVGTTAVVKHRRAESSPPPQTATRVVPPSSDPIPRLARPDDEAVAPVREPPRLALRADLKSGRSSSPSSPALVPGRDRESARPARPVAAPTESNPSPSPATSPNLPAEEPREPERDTWARSSRPSAAASIQTTSRPQNVCSTRDELGFLASVQMALREQRGEDALVLLDRYAQLCPAATFAEERRAARVLALCLLHREGQAIAEATRLATQAPRSPQLARLRSSCAAVAVPTSTNTREER